MMARVDEKIARPGEIYTDVLPEADSDRQHLLEENARKIEQEVNALMEGLENGTENKGGMGLDRKNLAIILPSLLSILSVLVVLFWPRPPGSQLFSGTFTLACGFGISFYLYTVQKRRRKEERQRYTSYIDSLMDKTVWRSSFIHMPGMDDEKAGQLKSLMMTRTPEESSKTFEKLFYLRMQYDMDQCAARLQVSRSMDFVNDFWLKDPRALDINGMNALCQAISRLDESMVVDLMENGERLDIQVRPYKIKFMENPLTLAYHARAAAREMADENDMTINQAWTALEDRRFSMFTLLLEANPRIWMETKHEGTPLGLSSCAGNPRFERAFESLSRRVQLKEIKSKSAKGEKEKEKPAL